MTDPNWPWVGYYVGSWYPITPERLAEVVSEIVGSQNYIGIKPGGEDAIDKQDTRVIVSDVHWLPESYSYRGWQARIALDKFRVTLPERVAFESALAIALGMPLIVSLPEENYAYGYWQVVEPNGDRWVTTDDTYIEERDEWVEGLDLNRKNWRPFNGWMVSKES